MILKETACFFSSQSVTVTLAEPRLSCVTRSEVSARAVWRLRAAAVITAGQDTGAFPSADPASATGWQRSVTPSQESALTAGRTPWDQPATGELSEQ